MYISKYEVEREVNSIYKTNLPFIDCIKVLMYRRKCRRNNRVFIDTYINDSFFDNISGYSLDYNQRKIILSDEDMLVVAGAGSGKTLTIFGKILYLVNKGVDSSRILCLSFTNETCNSLRKKCLDCGVDIDVLTFHKLGLSILKKSGFSKGIVSEDILFNIVKENVLKCDDIFKLIPDFKEFYNYQDYDDDLDIKRCIFENSYIFDNLCRSFVTFINLFKGSNRCFSDFDDFFKDNNMDMDSYRKEKNNIFLKLVRDIYWDYSFYLDKNHLMDFHDMINGAAGVLKEYDVCDYEYIIVDEYQDVSLNKCELLVELKKRTGAKIMCVGDDFQSIYGFTGSNLDVLFDFKKFFPYSKIFKIEKTYRNSQTLLDIMGSFIMKNPKQIRKHLISDIINECPIYIYYYDKSYIEVMNDILSDIGNDEYVILGRNNSDICGFDSSLTVHLSKGLEWNNVILINMVDKYNGFPNKFIYDDVFKYVTNISSDYLYDEERRLFYVAMTRTKNNVYIAVKRENPSIFIKELLEYDGVVVKN